MKALGNPVPDFACFAGNGAWSTDYRTIYKAGLAKKHAAPRGGPEMPRLLCCRILIKLRLIQSNRAAGAAAVRRG